MIALLLAAAAAAQTPIEAERTFAAAARKDGQWTAFRRYAAEDATMFVPAPVKAQAWLKDRKDPAKSIRWQPASSFVSCDGAFAVNTGAWQDPEGKAGFFSTVWQRQRGGGWKWVLDFGGALAKPRAKIVEPEVTQAKCRAPAAGHKLPEFASGGGSSTDGSLRWWYVVEASGRRTLAADYWDGRAFHPAIADQVDAPKK
jgi:hypothetical protein